MKWLGLKFLILSKKQNPKILCPNLWLLLFLIVFIRNGTTHTHTLTHTHLEQSGKAILSVSSAGF